MSEIKAIVADAVHAARTAGFGSDTEAKADTFELGARRAIDSVLRPKLKALTAERDALKAENERLQDEQSTVDHWSMGYRAGWEDCEAGKWKHISKAPKDGTHIIVPIGRGLCNVVSWFDGAWRETTNALRLTNEPQHWLPLPKPPVTP